MHRQDRIFILIFALICSLAAAFVISGCRRIPEHIMNSPPAMHRPNEIDQPKNETAPAPAELEPSTPRPQDRLASHVDDPSSPASESSPDKKLQLTAENALARIGAASVPSMVAELSSTDPQRRERAAQTLARIGPAAIEAAEPLLERLEDAQEDTAVQLACAEALKEMGPALWPQKPAEPMIESAPPPPMPALSDNDGDASQLAGTPPRRETLRIDYEERNARRQQLYEDQLQEYYRRQAIAERAVNVLKELALAN